MGCFSYYDMSLNAHLKSLEEEPPIKTGTVDPYVPAKKKGKKEK